MKWIWYEYEVDERPQSHSTTCAKKRQPVLPSSPPLREVWYQWSKDTLICLPTAYKVWQTPYLYMYEEDQVPHGVIIYIQPMTSTLHTMAMPSAVS